MSFCDFSRHPLFTIFGDGKDVKSFCNFFFFTVKRFTLTMEKKDWRLTWWVTLVPPTKKKKKKGEETAPKHLHTAQFQMMFF